MAAYAQKIGAMVTDAVQPGRLVYSLGFGFVGGLVGAGAHMAYRYVKVPLFDHDYYKLQSRLRYQEKQQIFAMEYEEQNEATYLASLSQEYDPVALRLPFQKLDDAHRL